MHGVFGYLYIRCVQQSHGKINEIGFAQNNEVGYILGMFNGAMAKIDFFFLLSRKTILAIYKSIIYSQYVKQHISRDSGDY